MASVVAAVVALVAFTATFAVGLFSVSAETALLRAFIYSAGAAVLTFALVMMFENHIMRGSSKRTVTHHVGDDVPGNPSTGNKGQVGG